MSKPNRYLFHVIFSATFVTYNDLFFQQRWLYLYSVTKKNIYIQRPHVKYEPGSVLLSAELA